MKIGLVTPFFLPKIGGANIYCYELAKALSAKGHEVHLFTIEGALEDDAYILHPILKMDLSQDIKSLRPFKMDVWHALFFFYAPLALYKENVFVTGHGDDCMDYRVRLTLPGKRWFTKNILWRFNGYVGKVSHSLISKIEIIMNYLVFYYAIVKINQIITVSHFTKKKLNTRYPFSARKVQVIPPGVSEQFFKIGKPKKISEVATKISLLTVTRLDEEDRIKNVHGVIEALGRLKDDYDFQYRVISGDHCGSYKAELQNMIIDLKLDQHVSIEGRKTEVELVQIYQEADLFLLVSYAEKRNFEGFGIVFLEANASGIPVLSSREGGMADYIKEGQNGFYVENPSAEGIYHALKNFLEGKVNFDSDKVKEFPQEYRWEHIAERVLEIYRLYNDGKRLPETTPDASNTMIEH